MTGKIHESLKDVTDCLIFFWCLMAQYKMELDPCSGVMPHTENETVMYVKFFYRGKTENILTSRSASTLNSKYRQRCLVWSLLFLLTIYSYSFFALE